MNGKIVYKDLAAGADEEAAYTATGQTSYSTLDFQGEEGEKYATLEPRRWALDGTFKIKPTAETVTFWSEAISGADGTFATPPKITCSFSSRHTATGITMTFDELTGEYCDEINVKWYRGSTQLANQDFEPDATTYIVEKTVEQFNRVEITLLKTSRPYRRARVSQIKIGAIRVFDGSELRAASCVNQCDLLSASLPASQLSFTLESKRAIDYVFQEKQPVEMLIGDELIGTYYISTSERTALRTYKVTAFDAIGVLGEEDFDGAAYLNGKNASGIVSDIVGNAFAVTVTATDKRLYGVLLPQTKRDALMQVLFAWGAIAATDGGGGIRIFDAPTTEKEIGRDKTFVGVSVTKNAIVTKVSVVEHSFAESAEGDIAIGNKKYTDTQTVHTADNPDAIAAKENVKAVTGATLVSRQNYADVLDRMLDYYGRRIVHKSRILYGGEKLGDKVAQPTPWESTEIGNIERINIVMSGVMTATVEARGNDT